MGNQFTDLSTPHPRISYYCGLDDSSIGFTHLMKLVTMTKDYPLHKT